MEDETDQDDSMEEDDENASVAIANGDSHAQRGENNRPAQEKPSDGTSSIFRTSKPVEESDTDSEDDQYEAIDGSSSDESGLEQDNAQITTEDEEDGRDEDDSEDFDDEGVRPRDSTSANRAALRKMMSEEQKIVVKSIAEATKADTAKGQALKQQRKAYDALLNTRIRLQKALIAVNTLPIAQSSETTGGHDSSDQGHGDAYVTAEEVALRLWTQLNSLRAQLQQSFPLSPDSNRKRKRALEQDSSASLSDLAQEMREGEVRASPYRRAVLEKWSAKMRGVTGHGLAASAARRLNNMVKQPTITDVLDEQLSNQDRLVKRTRVPRSCAPLQLRSKVFESEAVYDDADFYQMQLKELIDQRMVESTTGGAASAPGADPSIGSGASPWTAMREAKTRKKVDTRASKGRKLRFTVHDKLQNFMVPDDRSTWGKRQVDELFGSLLGASMRLDDDDDSDDGVDDDDDNDGMEKSERQRQRQREREKGEQQGVRNEERSQTESERLVLFRGR